jgi:hypothetical protein
MDVGISMLANDSHVIAIRMAAVGYWLLAIGALVDE